ncbi:hypothetical protein FB567DRAFT_595274 [Paraphoma chrysanthemicola]|uniref:Uncharacterized protein n=1 Tax=Paraphoma chrysanthemicola TaxID=798071 RepID=A0A8K0R2H4_9PLEO|nr:hypothetical protein FB567DRAFT_595274 [Paraphoma chrysanthemicola]
MSFVPHSNFQAGPDNQMYGTTGGVMEHAQDSYDDHVPSIETSYADMNEDAFIEDWERTFIHGQSSSSSNHPLGESSDMCMDLDPADAFTQQMLEEYLTSSELEELKAGLWDDDYSLSLSPNFMSDETDLKFAAMLAEMEAHQLSAEQVTHSDMITTDHKSASDICVKEALLPENLKQDLLRCPNFPEPSAEYPDDRLHFLAAELARCMRFSKIRTRWIRMHLCDWTHEMNLLLDAIGIPDNGFHPWAPLSEILEDYNKSTQQAEKIKWFKPQSIRGMFKRRLIKRMKEMDVKIGEVKQELKGLMSESFRVSYRQAIGIVQGVVNEDCEERGCLLFGTLPEADEDFRRKMSKSWSWTD